MKTPHQVLKEVFGYEEFREHQLEGITTILEGRDLLAVLSTSAGKSLIYQIPAIILEGTAIIVSPLIALMQDQTEEMNSRGVMARFYNSSLTVVQKREVREDLLTGEVKLLFMAPETLRGLNVSDMVPKVSMISIDEAHSISSDGFDFRPSYRDIIPFLKDVIKNTPVAALTATANKFVRDDIIRNLGLEDPTVIVGNPDRPEITLRPVELGKNEVWLKRNLLSVCKKALESGSVMIYIQNKAKCEKLGKQLRAQLPDSVPICVSHAGMASKARKESLERFMGSPNTLSVSTSALGLGINKPNVRTMIIIGTPKTCVELLQYYGRCSRDGEPSTTFIVVSPAADNAKNEYFLSLSKGGYDYKDKMRREFKKVAGILQPGRPSVDIRKDLVEYFK